MEREWGDTKKKKRKGDRRKGYIDRNARLLGSERAIAAPRNKESESEDYSRNTPYFKPRHSPGTPWVPAATRGDRLSQCR